MKALHNEHLEPPYIQETPYSGQDKPASKHVSSFQVVVEYFYCILSRDETRQLPHASQGGCIFLICTDKRYQYLLHLIFLIHTGCKWYKAHVILLGTVRVTISTSFYTEVRSIVAVCSSLLETQQDQYGVSRANCVETVYRPEIPCGVQYRMLESCQEQTIWREKAH